MNRKNMSRASSLNEAFKVKPERDGHRVSREFERKSSGEGVRPATKAPPAAGETYPIFSGPYCVEIT